MVTHSRSLVSFEGIQRSKIMQKENKTFFLFYFCNTFWITEGDEIEMIIFYWTRKKLWFLLFLLRNNKLWHSFFELLFEKEILLWDTYLLFYWINYKTYFLVSSQYKMWVSQRQMGILRRHSWRLVMWFRTSMDDCYLCT